MVVKTGVDLIINTDRLIDDLNYFSRNIGFGKMPAYLIMNSKTLQMLKQSSVFNTTLDDTGEITFYGITIAVSEGLKDYKIDLVG